MIDEILANEIVFLYSFSFCIIFWIISYFGFFSGEIMTCRKIGCEEKIDFTYPCISGLCTGHCEAEIEKGEYQEQEMRDRKHGE